jgi:hypothetical protein
MAPVICTVSLIYFYMGQGGHSCSISRPHILVHRGSIQIRMLMVAMGRVVVFLTTFFTLCPLPLKTMTQIAIGPDGRKQTSGRTGPMSPSRHLSSHTFLCCIVLIRLAARLMTCPLNAVVVMSESAGLTLVVSISKVRSSLHRIQ